MTNSDPAHAPGLVPQPDAERARFAAEFARLASAVARPVFERYARLAMRRGFAVIVKEQLDADNNPGLLLRVIPGRGGSLAEMQEGGGECLYALKAVLAEQMVVHSACHDARRGWGGMSITQSGLHSINHGFLEAALDQFLNGALDARRFAHAG